MEQKHTMGFLRFNSLNITGSLPLQFSGDGKDYRQLGPPVTASCCQDDISAFEGLENGLAWDIPNRSRLVWSEINPERDPLPISYPRAPGWY